MYDQLWEENPKIQKIRAESRAEGEEKGKVEALQRAVVTVVDTRFPALSELAQERLKRVTKLDSLDLMVRLIVSAQDENVARQILNLVAA